MSHSRRRYSCSCGYPSVLAGIINRAGKNLDGSATLHGTLNSDLTEFVSLLPVLSDVVMWRCVDIDSAVPYSSRKCRCLLYTVNLRLPDPEPKRNGDIRANLHLAHHCMIQTRPSFPSFNKDHESGIRNTKSNTP